VSSFPGTRRRVEENPAESLAVLLALLTPLAESRLATWRGVSRYSLRRSGNFARENRREGITKLDIGLSSDYDDDDDDDDDDDVFLPVDPMRKSA